MKPRLLVVEDEAHLASGLKLNFTLEGYDVTVAPTLRDAGLRLMDPLGFQVILLDVMLPDGDGVAFCRTLRDAGNFTPVLMLTAKSSPDERVRGLEAGADDYLPKPFELAELIARVKSMLRRAQWTSPSDAPLAAEVLTFGATTVDFAAMTAHRDGAPVTVTRLELDLLRYFARNAGRVVSRSELLEHVWEVSATSHTRTVDNFVLRLRKHFEPDPHTPRHFLSVRGAGYKFVP